ncbi:4Fe-4S binding protein [Clostridiaceae bacterium M8S5]|nr:4Fe-4S binding protein [Clostridiaceae bacterium M8S5]
MKRLQVIRTISQAVFIVLFIVGVYNNIPYMAQGIILLAVLLGPIFCGFICPFGFMQDLSARLGNILGVKQRQMPKKIQKILVFTRYLLFLLVAIFSVTFIMKLLSFDPRVNILQIINGKVIATSGLISIGLFLVIGIFFKRPFCNYLCFEGAKLGLLGIVRPFRIKRDQDKCVGCKKCDKACTMNINISNSKRVDSLQCVNCYECISNCPIEGTLRVQPVFKDIKEFTMNIKHKKSKWSKKKIVITLACAVIMAFGGVIMYKLNKGFPKYINTQARVSENQELLTLETVSLDDGVYYGEAKGFKGLIKTKVTVLNNRIKSIEVTSNQDDARWFNHANSIIPNEIIRNQATQVDSVSGATYSSTGIINSVKNALGETDYLQVNGH